MQTSRITAERGSFNRIRQVAPKRYRPTQSTTWFLGHTGVFMRNGISINLAVFAGLTVVTVTQTDIHV